MLTTLISAPLSLSQITTNKLTPNSEAQQSTPAAHSKPAETEKNPAQIELLETKYRFETNGDARKEVHTRVRINNELGVREFARLNFDFNRSFQAIEIPMVRITHPSGGIADILPGAITDNPHPAVLDFPAYHDVRVKSVRILGLTPGDLLEYRVITTTTHHPLAPDFWLDHTFDRSGVVSHEIFELDLPTSRNPTIKINPAAPASAKEQSGEGESGRSRYRWNVSSDSPDKQDAAKPDVVVTTFASWKHLAQKLRQSLQARNTPQSEIREKAIELTGEELERPKKIEALYDFVSKKITTVDLQLGSTGFSTRSPKEILASGNATAEDKFVLFRSLASSLNIGSTFAVTGRTDKLADRVPLPSILSDLLVVVQWPSELPPGGGCEDCYDSVLLDPAVDVLPYGAIPANLRGKQALTYDDFPFPGERFQIVPSGLPFTSSQRVVVAAELSNSAELTAEVKYSLRGDNELLLRVAFHKAPKEEWKDVAQLLAISDGFRGEIKNVTASDPFATKEPFTVEYEIEQPKFVDRSKKTVRIPALLPSPSLPDATPTSSSDSKRKIIDLGTPLDIELTATVQLPPGTSAFAPTGTSVERDYATFSSKYAVVKSDSPSGGITITASRKLRFLLKEIPAERAADFNAFLHAVQSDQAQLFTLQPPAPQK